MACVRAAGRLRVPDAIPRQPHTREPPLRRREPARGSREVGQRQEGGERDEARTGTLDKKKPSPPREPVGAVEALQETSRDQPAEHTRKRDGRVVGAVAAAELAPLVPCREQKEDARGEAGLEGAEEEAQAREGLPGVYGCYAHRDGAPEEHEGLGLGSVINLRMYGSTYSMALW